MRLRDDLPGLRPGRVLLLVTAGVLLVTLFPRFGTTEDVPVLCLFCGSEGAADFVLNVLLFLPVGFLACRFLPKPLQAAAGAVLLTVGIEATQFLIPGRSPTVGDLVANSLGGFAGIGLATFLTRRPDSKRRPAVVALIPSLLVALSLPITVYLLEPETPTAVYYGQWTAELGHLATYPGTLHGAHVGEVPLPGHRLGPEAVAAIRAMAAGAPLRVDYTAATSPSGLAPIFSVFDRQQAELLLIGVDHDAIVVRMRRRASKLGFRAPPLTYAGFHSASGTRATLSVRREDGDVCLYDAGSTSCRRLATPGRSWSLLLGATPGMLPAGLLDAGWLAMLGFLAVAAASALHYSVDRRIRAAAFAQPFVVYVALWLIAGGAWSFGLIGLVLGSGVAYRR
ncbi:MAG: VanZ family protein [Gemmatimonadota bacterium]